MDFMMLNNTNLVIYPDKKINSSTTKLLSELIRVLESETFVGISTELTQNSVVKLLRDRYSYYISVFESKFIYRKPLEESSFMYSIIVRNFNLMKKELNIVIQEEKEFDSYEDALEYGINLSIKDILISKLNNIL